MAPKWSAIRQLASGLPICRHARPAVTGVCSRRFDFVLTNCVAACNYRRFSSSQESASLPPDRSIPSVKGPSMEAELTDEETEILRVLKMEEMAARRKSRIDNMIYESIDPFQRRIRNFGIIAHIDHGKSTVADCLLRFTNTVDSSRLEKQAQFLDDMELERERGITIKLRAARLKYFPPNQAPGGEPYILNLIDTPGHVDFAYEVSRSLAAVEGVLLIVDASQGVEAQTCANLDVAIANNLEIIPVLNKIDLPGAQPDKVLKQVVELTGLDPTVAVLASAKNGIGIDQILDRIVTCIPPPLGHSKDVALQALIFDSYYDVYKGVVALIRVKSGSVKKGDRIIMMSTGKEYTVESVGHFIPERHDIDNALTCGEVGYLSANIKSVGDARVGDTITLFKAPASEPLPGYKKVKPMVYCGMFPIDTGASGFEGLRVALDKLALSDSSISYEPISSTSLGPGFKVGFLGLLHMDIIQERLDREFGADVLVTSPTVVYRIITRSKSVKYVSNPSEVDMEEVSVFEEPMANVDIFAPQEYVGALMEGIRQRRSTLVHTKYVDSSKVQLKYTMPLIEAICDLHDFVKSRSKGYASVDYSMSGYQAADLARVDIAIMGEPVDGFAFIEHRDRAASRGRVIAKKLATLIPRHQFKIAIQVMIGTRAVASEHIQALRKDVTAKCYGGDVTRKMKLLKKQAEGKKRLKMVGKVSLPQEAFKSILASGDS